MMYFPCSIQPKDTGLSNLWGDAKMYVINHEDDDDDDTITISSDDSSEEESS